DEVGRDRQIDQDQRPGSRAREPLEEWVIEHLGLSRPRRSPVVHTECYGTDTGHRAGREPTESGRPNRACRGVRRLQKTAPRLTHARSLAALSYTGKAMAHEPTTIDRDSSPAHQSGV